MGRMTEQAQAQGEDQIEMERGREQMMGERDEGRDVLTGKQWTVWKEPYVEGSRWRNCIRDTGWALWRMVDDGRRPRYLGDKRAAGLIRIQSLLDSVLGPGTEADVCRREVRGGRSLSSTGASKRRRYLKRGPVVSPGRRRRRRRRKRGQLVQDVARAGWNPR